MIQMNQHPRVPCRIVASPAAIIDMRIKSSACVAVPPTEFTMTTTYSQPTDMRKTCWIETPNRTNSGGVSSTSYRSAVGFLRRWRLSSEAPGRNNASNRSRTDSGIKLGSPSEAMFRSLDVIERENEREATHPRKRDGLYANDVLLHCKFQGESACDRIS